MTKTGIHSKFMTRSSLCVGFIEKMKMPRVEWKY